MTSERIDHAGEAAICYEYARRPGLTKHEARQAMRQGQIHASLALVEQQRIANVLTMAIEEAAQGYRGEWVKAKHPDIAAALGLDQS